MKDEEGKHIVKGLAYFHSYTPRLFNTELGTVVSNAVSSKLTFVPMISVRSDAQ